MKIDTSKQGYEPIWKDKVFKTESGFKRWINKKGKYIISFKDNGQDCLEWVIDERGEVIHANLQAGVWNGLMVDLEKLKIGKKIGVMVPKKMATRFYDFIVKSITDPNEL